MKKYILITLIFISGFIQSNAQEPKKITKTKQAEQNEIKADQHLQKDLQQKQLLMKPECLEDKTVEKINQEKSTKADKKPRNKNTSKYKQAA
ncbi:MAG TPA: hypothetical protein VF623_08745 [Segetibacter sp.]